MCLESIEEALRHSTLDGRLVLSGIPSSVEEDVDRAYRRLGMHHVLARSHAGWSAFVLQASW
jgi:ribosomal protein L11 methylase PrmA